MSGTSHLEPKTGFKASDEKSSNTNRSTEPDELAPKADWTKPDLEDLLNDELYGGMTLAYEW